MRIICWTANTTGIFWLQDIIRKITFHLYAYLDQEKKAPLWSWNLKDISSLFMTPGYFNRIPMFSNHLYCLMFNFRKNDQSQSCSLRLQILKYNLHPVAQTVACDKMISQFSLWHRRSCASLLRRTYSTLLCFILFYSILFYSYAYSTLL